MKLCYPTAIYLTIVTILSTQNATYSEDSEHAPKSKTLFNLIICLYNETNKQRANEYLYCLKRNLSNPLIKLIHVSYDTSCDSKKCRYIRQWLQGHNIPTSYIDRRQNLGDCIRLANKLFPNEYVIFSNADIWFDRSLGLLQKDDIEGHLVAISRQPRAPKYSQDSWIFKTPFPEHPHLDMTYVGLCGVEKPLIFAAQENCLQVYNPCKTIQCMHEHRAQVRHRNGINHWGTIPLRPCSLANKVYGLSKKERERNTKKRRRKKCIKGDSNASKTLARHNRHHRPYMLKTRSHKHR